MMAQTGFILLLTGGLLALSQIISGILYVKRASLTYLRLQHKLCIAQFFVLSASLLSLIALFLLNDFSVDYVATHSNTQLPLFYKVGAVWGAHEGSLLLWVVILASWNLVLSYLNRSLESNLQSMSLSIAGLLQICFIGFTVLTSNPFNQTLTSFVLEGLELNPLLQDPGLVLHPPLLYFGYGGFAAVFTQILAGLIRGELSHPLLQNTRIVLLLAWCALTVGITMGSWWAYRELGWGGYWFWDPVENSSLMPWLLSTALVHTLILAQRRQIFLNWTVLLSILTFGLALLGTFLVRSGVLVSVHAFAADPARGVYLLLLFTLIMGSALSIFLWRAPRLKRTAQSTLTATDIFFALNNMLLTAAAATVLIGTIYPLVLEVFSLGKISIGPPYFNMAMAPLVSCLFFAMGVTLLLLVYQRRHLKMLTLRILFSLILIAVFAALSFIFTGENPLLVFATLFFAAWILFSCLIFALDRWQAQPLSFNFTQRCRALPWPVLFAHSGVALVILGVGLSTAGNIEREVRLDVGESTQLQEYVIHFRSIQQIAVNNYEGFQAVLEISNPDKSDHIILKPEKRYYPSAQMALSDTAINASLTRDIYTALGEPLDEEGLVWSMRLYYKPYIRFIWGGGLLMAFAAFLSLIRNVRRLKESKSHV